MNWIVLRKSIDRKSFDFFVVERVCDALADVGPYVANTVVI